MPDYIPCTIAWGSGARAFSRTSTVSQSGRLSYWPYGVGDLDADGDLDYVSVSTCGYCASTWRGGKVD
jgi:hypothetical protein